MRLSNLLHSINATLKGWRSKLPLNASCAFAAKANPIGVPGPRLAPASAYKPLARIAAVARGRNSGSGTPMDLPGCLPTPVGGSPRPDYARPGRPRCPLERRPSATRVPRLPGAAPTQPPGASASRGSPSRTDHHAGDQTASSSVIRATRTAMSSAGSATRRLMRAEAYAGPKGTAFPASMACASLSMPASMGASRDSIRPSV